MFYSWVKSGSPWVWLSAMTVSISLLMVFGLLAMLVLKGFGHFWPADVYQLQFDDVSVIGEMKQREAIPLSAGQEENSREYRRLFKTGNRDLTGRDFRWISESQLGSLNEPTDIVVLERREWGNFYGYIRGIKEDGQVINVENDAQLWPELEKRLARTLTIFEQIRTIEKDDIGAINYQLERLRLKQRKLELNNALNDESQASIERQRQSLNEQYQVLQKSLNEEYAAIARDTLIVAADDGRTAEVQLQKIVRAYRPNAMGIIDKLGFYFDKVWEFISDDPREANTEGGIFPAIYGTVLMVLIMSLLVTPFGVIAAVYLREYAHQGPLVRLIRIAVNNLAGVPSIVYGVFGLGFFVYFLGGHLDQLFFPEALPAPTFGTPGLMWASLTLAILTVPVVIVATEEGLTRVPRNIREGSLALGATKAETLMKTVLPMASPAIMTGMILAIARAAGEVAPLMLVGVVKLAPSLPLDTNFPFLHLDRKFMHLGFHIYDVGFQSPNVEAARPLVYATALLLVLVIVFLNLAAISIRNRLREKNRALET